MDVNAKVIIVGAGINGLTTAWHLNRKGYRVSVFDRGPIPNPVSSSFDEHRVTRHAYGAMRDYAARMPEAFSLWEELFADIGARHFDPLPVVAFEREPSGWIDPSIEDLSRMGIAWRELDIADFQSAHPLINTEGVTRAVELHGSGVLFPNRILTDLVVHLAAQGVTFHPHTDVTDIDTENGTITVGGELHMADHLVIAAGAWVTRLLPEFAATLVPSRQTVVFLAPPRKFAGLWASAPVYFDLDAETGTYVLPPRPGTRLKIGDHRFTRTGEPDQPRLASEDEVARLIDACRAGYTDFDDYMILERKACYYTVTEDESFVLQSAGAKATLMSACSGHGFKLAPQSARIVADLVSQALPL
ncbi:NAD(P)/FAD-dependent oxidoreductase [Rhizobium oryzicola]|uniref:FAD-dependent oxidoreductase n=1 Tax=Rhizobium oryzicola TaxID=1232668 RepID=A0ABT8SXP2_9HYPH|nr:FAD-dependent oxidoreductase [Rhizobium oryzicola]MDO1583230.1 FAD-dependent oxidoreductase [Rhizobium oryzicola]